MGDRALVIFHDKYRISPGVYLHWHGDQVPALLAELAEYMKGRYGDAAYAAARFTGLCHRRIDDNLSLGIVSNQLRHADLGDAAELDEMSPGNAGVVIVDTGDFTWKASGGYLAERPRSTAPSPLRLVKPTNPNE